MEVARPSGEKGKDTSSEHAAPALSAPRMTPDGVLFALEAPDARRVLLAGDFNGWALDGNEMTPTGTVWTSLLKLQPGRYRYRYVIDGDWRSDPLNMEVEPSPYGGHNSVVVVVDNSPGDSVDAVG